MQEYAQISSKFSLLVLEIVICHAGNSCCVLISRWGGEWRSAVIFSPQWWEASPQVLIFSCWNRLFVIFEGSDLNFLVWFLILSESTYVHICYSCDRNTLTLIFQIFEVVQEFRKIKLISSSLNNNLKIKSTHRLYNSQSRFICSTLF